MKMQVSIIVVLTIIILSVLIQVLEAGKKKKDVIIITGGDHHHNHCNCGHKRKKNKVTYFPVPYPVYHHYPKMQQKKINSYDDHDNNDYWGNEQWDR